MKINNVAKVAALLLATTAPVTAVAGDFFDQMFKEGTPYGEFRYRYEYADQAGKAENAHASTLRTRLGFETGQYKGFTGLLEFENISQLGADNYNDTLNGRTDHPVVADIESTEINQMYLEYAGLQDTRIRVGREALAIDNHRFIGDVRWRQNNQTYDNINVVNTSIPDTKVMYAYVNNANRIFGEDSPNGDWNMDSHLLNVNNTSTPLGKITAYAYLLDIEDAPTLSSETYGASLIGSQAISDDWNFKYHLEYARQSDYGDNTVSYDANYYHIAPALNYGGFTATIGMEVLGSDDGIIGFSTPLSTLHKFNGWADLFLSTPADGLEDLYVDLTYKFGDVGDEWLDNLLLKARYHDFSADEGSADYGTEIDFYVKKPFMDHYFVEARYANYDADQFAVDTERFIFGLGAKF